MVKLTAPRLTRVLIVFAALSAIPFLKAASGLIRYSLSDVPEAYLVAIPAVAYFWMVIRLRRVAAEPLRRSQTFWAVAAVVGVGLVLWVSLGGRYSGLANTPILLLWPAWTAFVASVLFGPGILTVLWPSLLYLYLAWPPVYIAIINLINPSLERMAFLALNTWARQVNFVHSLGGGHYAVHAPSHWLIANVTLACSGSDSVLALLAIFPVVLILFQSTVFRRGALVALGSVAAFMLNIGRIMVILWVVHRFGSYWGFDVVHPLLGPVVFVLLLVVLFSLSGTVNRQARNGGAKPHSRSRAAMGLLVAGAAVLTAVLSGLL